MFNKKPKTPDEFVKMIYQFKQLIEVEGEFNGLPPTIERQIDLFQEWFLDQWEKNE